MIQPKYSFRIISCFLRISLIRPCTFAPFPALLIFSAFKTQTFCPSLICEFYLNPQCFILGKLFAQLCPTLCDPTDCSPPGSSPLSMGFSREEYWSGLLFRPPGDLPDSGIKPGSPALQADSLPPEPPGKPLFFHPGAVQLMVTQLCPGLETLGRVFCVPLSSSKAVTHRVWCCLQSPSHLHSAFASW